MVLYSLAQLLLVLCCHAPAYADTIVGGVIGTNTTWKLSESPFLVSSDVVVDSSATLTVESGITVRFNAGTRLIVQHGALLVLGTASAPVFFTSWRDQAGGTPAAGDWGGLQFFDNTNDLTTLLEYSTISYGATTELHGASPTFNNCVFKNNAGHALTIDLSSFPHGSGNHAVNNGNDSILVPAGELTTSGVWDMTSIPYQLAGKVSIGLAPIISGITTTIIQQGGTATAVISGSRLSGAKAVTFNVPGVTAVIQPGGTDTTVPVQISVDADTSIGPVSFSLKAAAGVPSFESGITIVPSVPHINSVTPNQIYVNNEAVIVEIIGVNLSSISTVYLDNVQLVSTCVNPTTIRATVPAQLLQASRLLVVKKPDPVHQGSFIVSNGVVFNIILPQFVFSPASITLRQEETGAFLNLAIPFAAPSGGITVGLTSTNPLVAAVPSTVLIPAGATSVSIPVTAPKTANNQDVTLDIHANQNNWSGGKATVTVRPKPTINLKPTTILTGQGYTQFLTISLTDPAPAGGLSVALAVTPTGIVTCPASMTIPAGATSGQVSIIAGGVGSATITASGPTFLSGDSSQVTVKPTQTYNIGPQLSAPLGVMVAVPNPPGTVAKTYAPVTNGIVGVVVGSALTGVTPNHVAVNTTGFKIRVNGVNLANVTSIAFVPSTGITLQSGTLVVAPDGSYAEVNFDVAADAPLNQRSVVVSTPANAIKPANPDSLKLLVTYAEPQLWSVIPPNAVVGMTFNFQVNGRNLQQASEISFVPPDGISAGNPPTISSDGTLANLNVTISNGAAVGKRAVRIATPAGITTDSLSAANSFSVLSSAGKLYTPVSALPLGVTVAMPQAPATEHKTYAALKSLPVGVVVGSTMTEVVPGSGAIGTSGLTVRITGYGLGTTTGISFNPATGITILPGTFAIAADGSYAEFKIDIAADAPLSERIVILAGSTAKQTGPEANRFRVTLPVPNILGIQPIRREVGSTVTMTIVGKNFSSATRVHVLPDTGISVSNPPTVSGDGTLATVTMAIDSAAPLGARAITITTPGGTTSSTPTEVNTLTLTATHGTDYTPVISMPLGVLVSKTVSNTVSSVYGPFSAVTVGIMVSPSAPPTTYNASYGPIISQPIGITVGPALTGIYPKIASPGTTTTVTLTGIGLSAVTSAAVQPATGITLGTMMVSPDGLSVTLPLTLDAAAVVGRRTVVLSTAGGAIKAANLLANELLVGPQPVINSIVPIISNVGTTLTLTIHGTNLKDVNAVRIEPADGITVDAKPNWTQDATGEHVTVTVVLAGDAAGGNRAVILSTPYGSSSLAATAANTFTVNRPIAENVPRTEIPRVATASGSYRMCEPKSTHESNSLSVVAPSLCNQRSAIIARSGIGLSSVAVVSGKADILWTAGHEVMAGLNSASENGLRYRGPPGPTAEQEYSMLKLILLQPQGDMT